MRKPTPYKDHMLDINGDCILCGKQIRSYEPQGYAGPDNWEYEYTEDADKPCFVKGKAGE